MELSNCNRIDYSLVYYTSDIILKIHLIFYKFFIKQEYRCICLFMINKPYNYFIRPWIIAPSSRTSGKKSAKMMYNDDNYYIIISVCAVLFNTNILTNVSCVKLNDSLWPLYDSFSEKTQYLKRTRHGFR